ncbi:hypothetical protein, partial [Stenotrophomonas maltophilia]|uniref:hypothetical protein n=2 Tax=Stenotrophomonas maltophilia TaxID=40324 RepID=UPI0025532AC7
TLVGTKTPTKVGIYQGIPRPASLTPAKRGVIDIPGNGKPGAHTGQCESGRMPDPETMHPLR